MTYRELINGEDAFGAPFWRQSSTVKQDVFLFSGKVIEPRLACLQFFLLYLFYFSKDNNSDSSLYQSTQTL